MQTAMMTIQSLMGQSKEQLQSKEKECKLLQEGVAQVSRYELLVQCDELTSAALSQAQDELKENKQQVVLLGQQLEQVQAEKTDLVRV